MLALLRRNYPPRRCTLLTRTLPTRTITSRPSTLPAFIDPWMPSNHDRVPPRDAFIDRTVAREHIVKGLRQSLTRQIPAQNHDKVTILAPGLCNIDAIRQLNRHLVNSTSRRPNKHLRCLLWRSYFMAKDVIPSLPKFLPDRAWNVLWNTQFYQKPKLKYPRARMQEIYQDMRSAGKSATLTQTTIYLESLFYNGKTEKALDEWETGYKQIRRTTQEDFAKYLELGAKMYAFADNIDRAGEIVETMAAVFPNQVSRVMMAVFRAHTRSTSAQHHEAARKMYLWMKNSKGATATVEHFDSWFIGFLEARHLQYAIDVFQDMVNAGRLATHVDALKDGDGRHIPSENEVNRVLRMLHKLYQLGADIEKMTMIILSALSVLPKCYHNHLFGDWMKTATVRKAPEAAAQILEMMFKRGNSPDSFHFNCLLQVLLRTSRTSSVQKGEDIGWRMVEAAHTSPAPPPCPTFAGSITDCSQWKPAADILPDDPRIIAPANITTYALLIEHHGKKSQWEHVDYLIRQMKDSGLPMNTSMMNVLMNIYCQKGNHNAAWELFKSLTIDIPEGFPSVFPNGSSIRILWRTLWLALKDPESREHNTLPLPRWLLKETLKWWSLVRSRPDAERFRIGLASPHHGAIVPLIMLCFSHSKDLPGTLVAVHALYKTLGIPVPEKGLDILHKHLAWTDLSAEDDSFRGQFGRSSIFEERIRQMEAVNVLLMRNRFARENITGDQFAYMSEKEKMDFSLNHISEFIRVVLKRKHGLESVEALIDHAKAECGVPNLKTGDMDASEVD